MRIGVFVGASVADLMTLDGLLARIKQAEDDGFDSFWIPHISARGYDALTTLAMAGMQTSRIELGVGVVPTYPRHPAALAQQALTTATATNVAGSSWASARRTAPGWRTVSASPTTARRCTPASTCR